MTEPVAWRYRPSAVWDDYVLTDDPGKAARARANGLHVEALCLTTPQPTQAQAGAVPLTLRWCAHCGEGVTNFCRSKPAGDCPIGLPRIKGGQHVGKVD